MKLRNKKTGEIPDKIETITYIQWSKKIMMVYINNDGERILKHYYSLEAFNEEWEDYEEDELLYVISAEHKSGYQCVLKEEYPEICEVAKELGIGFETEKECQEFCNKLLAWKRLKDGGITFKNWTINQTGTIDCFATWGDNIPPSRKNPTLLEDLDLLFGGEK